MHTYVVLAVFACVAGACFYLYHAHKKAVLASLARVESDLHIVKAATTAPAAPHVVAPAAPAPAPVAAANVSKPSK